MDILVSSPVSIIALLTNQHGGSAEHEKVTDRRIIVDLHRR
jgi:hypothetical protein